MAVWITALLALVGVALVIAYQSAHYFAGWAMAVIFLIPLAPLTLFCVCNLWPGWDRKERTYNRGKVLWYFAATKDPLDQNDRKIEGRCPTCEKRIEFAPGEKPSCSLCPDMDFGFDGEYNGVKESVIADAVADFKSGNGFQYVNAWRTYYYRLASCVVALACAFGFITRPVVPNAEQDGGPGDSYPYIVPFLDPVKGGYQLDFTLYAASKSGKRVQLVGFGLSEIYDVSAYDAIEKQLGKKPRGKQSWPAIYSFNGVAGAGPSHVYTARLSQNRKPIFIPNDSVRRKFTVKFPAETGTYAEEIYISTVGGVAECDGSISEIGGEKLRSISCP